MVGCHFPDVGESACRTKSHVIGNFLESSCRKWRCPGFREKVTVCKKLVTWTQSFRIVDMFLETSCPKVESSRITRDDLQIDLQPGRSLFDSSRLFWKARAKKRGCPANKLVSWAQPFRIVEVVWKSRSQTWICPGAREMLKMCE